MSEDYVVSWYAKDAITAATSINGPKNLKRFYEVCDIVVRALEAKTDIPTDGRDYDDLVPDREEALRIVKDLRSLPGYILGEGAGEAELENAMAVEARLNEIAALPLFKEPDLKEAWIVGLSRDGIYGGIMDAIASVHGPAAEHGLVLANDDGLPEDEVFIFVTGQGTPNINAFEAAIAGKSWFSYLQKVTPEVARAYGAPHAHL